MDFKDEPGAIRYARIAGILYLVIIIAGIFAEMFVRDKLFVAGNPAATAGNITTNEGLWRLGFAAQIIMLICDVGVTVILYLLLKPVSRNISLTSAAFRLTSISILGINGLNHFGVLFLLGGGENIGGFNPQQINGLIYLLMKAHSNGYNISLVFFGIHCLFLGYLLFASGYFPRVLGMLIVVCGACYITNSFAWFVSPATAEILYPMIMLPCFIGELALCLWLIIKGLRGKVWKIRATGGGLNMLINF